MAELPTEECVLGVETSSSEEGGLGRNRSEERDMGGVRGDGVEGVVWWAGAVVRKQEMGRRGGAGDGRRETRDGRQETRHKKRGERGWMQKTRDTPRLNHCHYMRAKSLLSVVAQGRCHAAEEFCNKKVKRFRFL